MRILHLSDTHVSQAPGPDAEGVDARAVLGSLLHDLRHLPGVDLVVVTGDVADDGSQDAYRDAMALVAGFAGERGAPLVLCTGNHDERVAFAAVLGSGHLDAAGRDAGRLALPGGDERAAVSYAAGHRIITLDSLVPGQVHGEVGPAQLAWLRNLLSTPHGDGTVVALHHPPVALPGTIQERVGLRNPDELADAIRGSDVRAVLCGHYHLQLAGQLAGVPVGVGAAVLTRVDLTAPPGLERAVRGAGCTVVDLPPQGPPLFHTLHARDPQVGQSVYLIDTATGEDVPTETAAPGEGAAQ